MSLFIIGGVFLISTYFKFDEMGSSSMEPTIMGEENSPSHNGDYVITSRFFRHPLSQGTLVLVTFPSSAGDPVRTVRRIAGIPGDRIPDLKNGTKNLDVTNGYYYLSADSTNGLDSKQLGLFSFDKIDGKVLWILHSRF